MTPRKHRRGRHAIWHPAGSCAFVLFVLSCAGRSKHATDEASGGSSPSSGTGGVLVAPAGSGGATPNGGNGGTATGGNSFVAGNSPVGGDGSGGIPAFDPGGAAGADTAGCDTYALWHAIEVGAVGVGTCQRQDPPATGMTASPRQGTVVFDHEGRIIDNTGLHGFDKQYWLDSVADERWPCLADQTIGYTCKPVGA